ncbi:discoidin domain-containing receptor 2-like isoform X1 [Acropora millepora]|uniref:discoidin domain-containing receptor 2-like isoform X1 n=1 Tax=Acropora millepora TaxID=45264 RepID=UPI001CF21515|nr:discoidin domain-containing receptor 2-like isoform X1 [Acropora millepora]XP_029206363.2 discoidin domain-containing receptor 2-like isoform X1 [Acropora millepora]XP_044184410.1 discoidin domain-containing receptor 2-like isoform X1 [Acropora millepora]
MSSICWLRFQCHILFLVSCCFSFLPFLSSQICNETPQSSAPFVEIIQTPSVDPQNHGSSLNLTCSAKLMNKRYSNPVYTRTQPCKIVWWFNRKKVKSCSRECSQAKGEMNCTLTLGGRENQLKVVGNFSCKASNGNYFCTLKRILLKHSFGIRTSQIAPVNRTAPTGCNSTFRCRTDGHPKPTTWIRNGSDSNILNETNPKINTTTDLEKGIRTSQIAPVNQTAPTSCNSTLRCRTGGHPKPTTWIRNGSDSNILNETNPSINTTTDPEKDASPLTNVMADSTHIGRVFAIAIPCIAVTLAICGLLYFLWYRKSRRRAKKCERDLRMSTYTDEEALLEMVYESPEDEDTVTFEQKTVESLNDTETNGSPGDDLGDKSKRELSPRHNADALPSSPPKPNEKFKGDERVECICILKGRDSGFDSSESSDNLFSDRKTIPNSRSSTISLGGHDIEENWQIDSQKLRVFDDEVLGEGEFGIVKKGHYGGRDVAVKQLKDTADVTENILSEIRILKQAGQHRNIVTFIGACINSGDTLLVIELITGESLLSFLKSKKVEFQTHQNDEYKNLNFGLNDRQLLNIALQIAFGMQHLHERKVIHRDLAARNVLIDQNNVVKVGDFGMARDISVDGIYTKTSDSKVPWRWLSIESLKDQVYTAFSDVWSYGILLWEIATYGGTPYPSIRTPDQLKKYLSSGVRMSRPENCCEVLYELMTSSWKENPSERTQFTDIARKLESCLNKVYERKYVNIKSGVGKCSDVEKMQP